MSRNHLAESGSDCADTSERRPRDMSWKVRHERIKGDGDHLSYVSNAMTDVGLYIAANALSPEKSYFEIEIIDPGKCSYIGIGLVPYNYPLDAHPGWQAFSVGYHADDGRLFEASGLGRPFGEKCNKGDLMGCGIKFANSEEKRKQLEKAVQVFFTRNDKEVGTVTVPYPPGGLFPAVGMHSKGESVRLILDAEWQYEEHNNKLDGMENGNLPKRNQPKQIVLNALGMKTWEEVKDSYDQASNMLQYNGDVSTTDGRMQFLTRAFELAKLGKTKWSVQITVQKNGVEIPVDKQLIDKHSDQILKEIKQKY